MKGLFLIGHISPNCLLTLVVFSVVVGVSNSYKFFPVRDNSIYSAVVLFRNELKRGSNSYDFNEQFYFSPLSALLCSKLNCIHSFYCPMPISFFVAIETFEPLSPIINVRNHKVSN